MLYVTPTSKKDVPDNTPALHIAAHKVPNANWNAEIFKVCIHYINTVEVPIHGKQPYPVVQNERHTVKTLNIGTPRPATVVVLNIKPFNFTMK